MAGLFGCLGSVGGVALSVLVIFPEGILSIKLAALTLGDISRVIAGLIVPIVTTAIGAGLGSQIGRNRY